MKVVFAWRYYLIESFTFYSFAFCRLLAIMVVRIVVLKAAIGRLTLAIVASATTCTSTVAVAARAVTTIRQTAILFVAFSRRKSGHGRQFFSYLCWMLYWHTVFRAQAGVGGAKVFPSAPFWFGKQLSYRGEYSMKVMFAWRYYFVKSFTFYSFAFCLLLAVIMAVVVVPTATIGRLRSTLAIVATATTWTSTVATATRMRTTLRRTPFLFVAFSRRKSGRGKQFFSYLCWM